MGFPHIFQIMQKYFN